MVGGAGDADRGGREVADRVAGGKGGRGVQRAGRQGATAATTNVRLDVAGNRRSRGVGFVFQSPFLLGAVDLAEVVDARVLLRGRAGMHEVRDRDSGEEADNCDDNHDFNQGETGFARGVAFHTITFSFLRGVNEATGGLLYDYEISFTELPIANRTWDKAAQMPQ